MAVLLSLSACGNRLSKEELLADNTVHSGAVSTGSVDSGSSSGAASERVPAQTGAVAAPLGSGAPVAASSPSPGSATKPSRTGGAAGTAAAPVPVSSGAGAPCSGPRTPIAIGTVGGQSGLIGAAMRPGSDAVKAWVADINARGGLACHPIRYYIADDGSDPAKNAALTQQMIDERHVVAMIMSTNPLSAQGGRPVLERAHVPTIGSEGGDEYFNTSPDFFPVAGSGTKLMGVNYGMLGERLTADQKAHFGIITCVEASVCSAFNGPAGEQVAGRFGLKVIYTSRASLVQPDYTAVCQGSKDAGVSALFLAADSGMTSRLIRSCNRIGYHPQYAASPIALSADAAQLPELENVMLAVSAKPWTVDDANVKRYVSALARYVPGAVPTGTGSVGWAAALMLERVGANLPETPTPADIYEGLWKIKDVDLDGYTAPLTYAREKPAVYPTCWWTMAIVNKQWTSPNAGKRTCVKD